MVASLKLLHLEGRALQQARNEHFCAVAVCSRGQLYLLL